MGEERAHKDALIIQPSQILVGISWRWHAVSANSSLIAKTYGDPSPAID
jgi:hypothetical protein